MSINRQILDSAITHLGLRGWQAEITRELCLGCGVIATASRLQRDEVWILANLRAVYEHLGVESPQELVQLVHSLANPTPTPDDGYNCPS